MLVRYCDLCKAEVEEVILLKAVKFAKGDDGFDGPPKPAMKPIEMCPICFVQGVQPAIAKLQK